MSKFADLLLRSGNPADVQQRASRELPLVLSKSNFHLWDLDNSIFTEEAQYLVGVATWSLYDLRLLDALDKALSGGDKTKRVDVFDVDCCQTQKEISAFVPNIGKVFHTPVVCVWHNGQQINQASGHAGRSILVEAFALNNDEIVALARAG